MCVGYENGEFLDGERRWFEDMRKKRIFVDLCVSCRKAADAKHEKDLVIEKRKLEEAQWNKMQEENRATEKKREHELKMKDRELKMREHELKMKQEENRAREKEREHELKLKQEEYRAEENKRKQETEQMKEQQSEEMIRLTELEIERLKQENTQIELNIRLKRLVAAEKQPSPWQDVSVIQMNRCATLSWANKNRQLPRVY